ncbi:hypothetical protein NM688_g8494 [Phlebia brevispora]|uniref:Uncharacterized protein n=1 Tax=Phlebia brevispora TaxID=194682 RepID=A0ACC1RTF0_9APHY|nr:hypothetical protein NM688_g8494 [Phlebia brevispora]
MSSSTPDSATVTAYRANLVGNHMINVVLTIVCYELIATFRYEYEIVWQRNCLRSYPRSAFERPGVRHTAYRIHRAARGSHNHCRCYNPSLNRFVNVIYEVPALIVFGVFILLHAPDDLPRNATVFSAMRTFALLDRAYVTAAFILLLGLTSTALSLYQDNEVIHYYVDDPVLGSSCYYNYLISPSVVLNKKLTIASSLLTVATDIVAIIMTWIKTYHHVREASSIGIHAGFSTILLHYGTMYFVVLGLTNIADVILLIPSLELVNPAAVFLHSFPNIILSRFLINLRYINTAETSEIAAFSQFSPPNFRVPTLPSIIGNLGEPLAIGDERDDDADDDHEGGVNADTCKDCTRDVGHTGDNEGMSSDVDIADGQIEEVREPCASWFLRS